MAAPGLVVHCDSTSNAHRMTETIERFHGGTLFRAGPTTNGIDAYANQPVQSDVKISPPLARPKAFCSASFRLDPDAP